MINILRFIVKVVQGAIRRCPQWLIRCYLLSASKFCKRFLRGIWAVRCRNAVLDTHWPAVRLPPINVKFGGRALKFVPHLGQDDGDALWFRELPYEVGVASWVGNHVASAYDVVIEIGANVGLYTCLFGSLASEGSRLKRVYAFEPDADAFQLLRRNLSCNAIEVVTAFQVAVAEHSGFLEFFRPKNHLTNGSLKRDFAAHFASDISTSKVAAVTAIELERLINPGERILMKIDVEGFESELLSALSPLIKHFSPDLSVEVLPETESGIAAWVSENGYASALMTSNAQVLRGPIVANEIHRDWLLTPALNESLRISEKY